MNRLEQQVAPRIDQSAPAPVRGSVNITPPVTRGPDLTEAQNAMRNLAHLTLQLGEMREKAQNEADELAMLEFKGWIDREQTARAVEFSKLPLAEQERAVEEYRTNFMRDAEEFSQGLNFSRRRRQVVSRLTANYAGQFGGRLLMESTRALERSNCIKLVNYFNSVQSAGLVPETRECFAKLDEKGIDPGMTLDQAVSRACYANLKGRLPAKSHAELAAAIDAYKSDLAKNDREFPVGKDAKMLRPDLERLYNDALKERSRRYAENYKDFIARKERGEFDENDLEAAFAADWLERSQYKAIKGEFKEEARAVLAERADRLAEFRVRLSQMKFSASADKYDGSYIAVRDSIYNSPDLTGKERRTLLNDLNGMVRGAYSTPDGKDLDRWLQDNFIKKKTVNGQVQRKYSGLKWDPWGWRKEDSQEFQAARYMELREYGERLLAEGKPVAEIKTTIFDLAKKLRDNELPKEAQQFIIDGVSPEKYRAKPTKAVAAAVSRELGALPSAGRKNGLGRSSFPEGTKKFFNGKPVVTRNGVWEYE